MHRCWSDYVDAQADLHLCCSHKAYIGFSHDLAQFAFVFQGGFFVEDEDSETSSYFQPTGNPFNKDVSFVHF